MKIALSEVEWHAHGTGAGTLAPPRDPTFDSSYGGLIPLRVEGQARVMRKRSSISGRSDPCSEVTMGVPSHALPGSIGVDAGMCHPGAYTPQRGTLGI